MRAIAIDGPAGAGKSSVARAVAKRLGFIYIDTGAMYRAIALKASRLGINMEDEKAMALLTGQTELSFRNNGTVLLLDREDVSSAIRTPEITGITRFAARAPGVRTELVRRQQEMARNQPVVMEGRDICTVVLKDAQWKFFLTASARERARRRALEMRRAGHAVDESRILEEIKARDLSDAQVGPMKEAMEIARDPDGDIYLLDTTDLTPEQVVDEIAGVVEEGESRRQEAKSKR